MGGEYNVDISGLTNITSSSTAEADMNGKSNTAIIVAAHIDTGLTSSDSAAMYCYSYTTDGTKSSDWYLPAAGELYSYVRGNYSAINTAMTTIGWAFSSTYFWSSSEYYNQRAWAVYSASESTYLNDKQTKYSVVCFLAIS